MNVAPNTVVWDLFVAFSVKRSITQWQSRQVRPARGPEINSGSWNPPAAVETRSVA
jgi:hypothetical protein